MGREPESPLTIDLAEPSEFGEIYFVVYVVEFFQRSCCEGEGGEVVNLSLPHHTHITLHCGANDEEEVHVYTTWDRGQIGGVNPIP
jgi:hypothetical protein